MISDVAINNWNGETIHLELSSPQPELFEIKSIIPEATRCRRGEDRVERSTTSLRDSRRKPNDYYYDGVYNGGVV